MKKWIWLLACSLFLVSCNSQSIIEWVDFVKINGNHYERIHSGIIADPDSIGEKMGEVKFKVAGHVNDGKYKDIDKGSINQIEIYKEEKDNHPVLIRTLSEKQGIQDLTQILNEGKTNASFNPNTTQGDPTTYRLTFYTEEPIAYQFPLFYDGEQWYWIPEDTDLLSEDVERFILEK